jgi:hypothetical protein
MGRLGDQLIPEAKPEPRLGAMALRQIGCPSDQLIPGVILAVYRPESVAKNFWHLPTESGSPSISCA